MVFRYTFQKIMGGCQTRMQKMLQFFKMKASLDNFLCKTISGSIDLDELIDIICTFYDMEGVPRNESRRHAKRIFEALDEDGSGALDEAEFVKGCLTDPDFSRVIQHSIEKLKLMADD